MSGSIHAAPTVRCELLQSCTNCCPHFDARFYVVCPTAYLLCGSPMRQRIGEGKDELERCGWTSSDIGYSALGLGVSKM